MKEDEYAEGELEQMQQYADTAFNLLKTKIAGKKGITNYFHEFGSGHFLQMSRLWKNLARYRNEGAEAKNGDLTQIYLRHSNKGGFKGNNEKKKKNEESYVKEIAGKIEGVGKWCARMYMWQSGRAGELFAGKHHWLPRLKLCKEDYDSMSTAEQAAYDKGEHKGEFAEDDADYVEVVDCVDCTGGCGGGSGSGASDTEDWLDGSGSDGSEWGLRDHLHAQCTTYWRLSAALSGRGGQLECL